MSLQSCFTNKFFKNDLRTNTLEIKPKLKYFQLENGVKYKND